MGDSRAVRKSIDLQNLRALQARIPATLEIIRVEGNPPQSISCRIHIPTAKDRSFPRVKQGVSEIEIQLPDRYPEQLPIVYIRTPIWNPNVYASGKWCPNRSPGEDLKAFVIRLMKVIALDPAIVDPRSPANSEAARWYLEKKASQPNLFPTVSVTQLTTTAEKPDSEMRWHNLK